MPYPKRVAWIWILMVTALFFPGTTDGGHPNKIKKIDIEEIGEVIGNRGRYLLVFMAAWCAPCVKELPDINGLYEKYRERGLKMVGISIDLDGPLAMQPIVDRLKIKFPVYWLGEAAIDAYRIRGVPYLIFINNGEIVERLLGQRSKAYLDKKFEAFLTQP